MPFLQFKSGALHFADDIGFTFIKAFIAADGPENSVPAMGCVAMKFLLWMICYRFTNGTFVEPTSKQCYSHQSKTFGNRSAQHLLEPKIYEICI
jgi:hypothetical protein